MITSHLLISLRSFLNKGGHQAYIEHRTGPSRNRPTAAWSAHLRCCRIIRHPLLLLYPGVFARVLLAWISAGLIVHSARAADTPISDAAYPLLLQRTLTNRQAFYVYEAQDSAANHGFPSGFFGATQKAHIDTGCIDDPLSNTGFSTNMDVLDRQLRNVARITFDPLGAGQYAGINFEEPENWGRLRTGVGYNLTGATQLLVRLRCPTPGGMFAQFGVAGHAIPHADSWFSIPRTTNYNTLAISLAGIPASALASAHILFSVAVSVDAAPSSGTLLIDWIQFLPVPSSQAKAVGFPVATETFGVIPRTSPSANREPWPVDQVLRNLSPPYESAITALALLHRGTSNDLSAARIILDSFAYAATNDNHGDLLPATNGWFGLHNGYMAGDLPLFNAQGTGSGQKGGVRLAGFTVATNPPAFYLVLDGATGGNVSFAILAMCSGYIKLSDVRYLETARELSRWLVYYLKDTTATNYGGYYLGYPDNGEAKVLIRSKSIENNADIFAAFSTLAEVERLLGNTSAWNEWTTNAYAAGDFVMQMFDTNAGKFCAGTVPAGTPPGPGVVPTGPRCGDDVINTADFLDANTFTTLAMAQSPRYRDQINWRLPLQFMTNAFAQLITAAGHQYRGFNLLTNPLVGPNGVAWEFTGQAVLTMNMVDRLYGEVYFGPAAADYLNQIRAAQTNAPFGDGRGLVASTVQNGDALEPIEQCLSTPFQAIPERVGLAATTWAIFAERGFNPLSFTASFVDVTMPTNTITAPSSGQRWSNSVFTVTGTASDNLQVSNVWCQVNGSGWTEATTTNRWANWTAVVNLSPGTNLVQALAADATGNYSATNSVSFVCVLTNMLRVQTTGNGTFSPNYSNAFLVLGSNYAMTATAATGFKFTNWTGGTNLPFGVFTNNPKLTFTMASNLTLVANFADVAPPANATTFPAANQRLSNNSVTVTGTAHDNVQVSNVFLQLNAGAWQQARTFNGWTNWTTDLLLLPGANVLQAYSQDTSGNSSPTNKVTFLYIPSATLSVRSNGLGGITPIDNGKLLAIGSNYTLAAKPAKNWLFSNWVGGTTLPYTVLSTLPNYTFAMQSNLILQANFVTNPFLAVAGVYNGLFYPANGVTEASSGFISVAIPGNSSGAFSAKLLLDGGSNSFSGTFDLTGTAQTNLVRSGKTPVSVNLILDFNPDDTLLGGAVSNAVAGWNSVIQANRAVFSVTANPAADYAGEFTLLLPPDTNATQASPDGFGYAVITNTLGGISTFGGALADGTPILWSVPIARNGGVPLYQSLYSGKGSLLGWIYFTNQPPQNISTTSSLSWIKPSIPNSIYSSGFTNLTALFGSPYTNTARAGVPVLNLTNATLTLSSGNLTNGLLIFTNLGTNLSSHNSLTNLDAGTKNGPTNHLAIAINSNNGLVTLTFQPTGVKTNILAHGAVLQNQTNAAGYFIGTNQSGAFILAPR